MRTLLALASLSLFACRPQAAPAPVARTLVRADAAAAAIDVITPAVNAAVDASVIETSLPESPDLNPTVLEGPRPRAAAFCPAPVRCTVTPRAVEGAGSILEIATITSVENHDVGTVALRTARGWFGTAIRAEDVRTMIRSHHTPGSSAIDLALTRGTTNGVEVYTVSRNHSYMPGMGSQGSSTNLTVYMQRCSLTVTGAECENNGVVFQRTCNSGMACTEAGARPTGLANE